MKKALLFITSLLLISPIFSQTFTALDSGTGNQLNGVRLLSDNKGIVVGDGGKILTTTNGLNWQHRISGVTTNLKEVEYINPTTIIVVGDWGTILKSTNGGMGWTPKNSGTSEMLYSVCVNGSDIYACGQNGVILKSTDEGDSWTSINPGPGTHIFDIFFTSPTAGYAVGNDGYIFRTTDGGDDWNPYDLGISTDFQLRSIYFTDPDHGFVVGRNLVLNQSIILRTTDGGGTFVPQIVLGADYVEIKFLDANTGFILSQNLNVNTGSISKTTNGGANWSYLTGFSKTQTSMAFSGFNVSYTCGFNGTIFKSTNISLGIDDLVNDQPISVYPNPSSEKIFIKLDPSIQSESLTIEIYTISGDKIISSTDSSVDISEIPSGIYLMKIQSETSLWTKKIIKE
ncbi:MAG: YCF48-related protein [Fluviicola sp.]